MSSVLTCQFSALANCQLYSSAHCIAALFKVIVTTKMVSENQTEMNHSSSALQPVKKYCMHKYVNHIFPFLYDCSDHFFGHTHNQTQRHAAANCRAEIAKKGIHFLPVSGKLAFEWQDSTKYYIQPPFPSVFSLPLSLHTHTLSHTHKCTYM